MRNIQKKLDELTNWVKRPQIGARGLVYVKYNEDQTFKSSVDKFYNASNLKQWAKKCGANPGDLLLILSGEKPDIQSQMNELRLFMGSRLGLRDAKIFKPIWVVDFPLLEKDETNNSFHAMHHPFTSPKTSDLAMLETNPENVKANAYDLSINGVEVGGGSIEFMTGKFRKKCLRFLDLAKKKPKPNLDF